MKRLYAHIKPVRVSMLKMIFSLSGLLWCGLATAAVPAENANAPEDVWHFTVSPAFGAMGFRGNGAVGPLAGRLKMPFHKVAESTRFGMAGAVEADRGPLGIWLNGQYLDLSQDLNVKGGEATGHAKAYAALLDVGGAYRIWTQKTDGRTVFGGQQQMSLAPLAGLRWMRLKAMLDVGDQSASRRENWIIPFVGARFRADLSPHWLLATEADTGAWGQDFTLQGQAYLGYRLGLLGQPAVVRVGYQVLHQDHKDTDFHWDVTQSGPVIGMSVTF